MLKFIFLIYIYFETGKLTRFEKDLLSRIEHLTTNSNEMKKEFREKLNLILERIGHGVVVDVSAPEIELPLTTVKHWSDLSNRLNKKTTAAQLVSGFIPFSQMEIF